MSLPLISVLTPAYNREKYIVEAIESVQQQTIPNWEMIIVDDGSTDRTKELVQAYQAKDSRIKLFENPKNLGISATRNHGLQHVRGTYVAMLDSDDVCLAQRFEKQITFLDRNPQVGVLGGWAKHIGKSNRQFTPEQNDAQLRARSLYRCPMVHSSTMIRTSVVQECQLRYNENYPASNDYDFWVKALPFTQFHNLQEYLVQYRKHDQNISVTHGKDQKQYRVASSYLAFQNVLNLSLEKEAHEKLFGVLTAAFIAPSEVDALESTLKNFLEVVLNNSTIDHHYLLKAVYSKFVDAYQNASLPNKARLKFIIEHKVWKYIPIKKYYGVYGKLIAQEMLRTSKLKREAKTQ